MAVDEQRRRRRIIMRARTASELRKVTQRVEARANYYESQLSMQRELTSEWAAKAGMWQGVATRLRIEIETNGTRKDRQRIAKLWERLTTGL